MERAVCVYVHMRGEREYLEGVKECKDRAKRDDDDDDDDDDGDDDNDNARGTTGGCIERDVVGGWKRWCDRDVAEKHACPDCSRSLLYPDSRVHVVCVRVADRAR